MASITVTPTTNQVNVTKSTNNVTVTPTNTQVNVTKNTNNITVTSNKSNIVVRSNLNASVVPPVSWHLQVTTLTATDITNKYVHLDFLPDLQSLSFFVQDGLAQTLGVTFTITGSTLLWAGYPLETVLIVGDVFNIKYIIL